MHCCFLQEKEALGLCKRVCRWQPVSVTSESGPSIYDLVVSHQVVLYSSVNERLCGVHRMSRLKFATQSFAGSSKTQPALNSVRRGTQFQNDNTL